jgi:hypothetical protein
MNPNLDFEFNAKDFQSRIRTNSMGFRDDEESLSDPAVFLLGDSFAFGWGLEKEDACEAVLETQLGAKVLNMGVSGYNTVQEYLLLRRYADALEATGKTAVFLFYENDLMDNTSPLVGMYPAVYKTGRRVGFTKPTVEAYEAWLKPGDEGWLRYIGNRTCVGGAIDFSVGILKHLKKSEGWYRAHKADTSLGRFLDQYEVFEYLVRAIRAFARERNMKIAFVRIPDVESFRDPDREEKWLGKFTTILQTQSVPLLELESILGEEDYFKHDPHWNESGHRKAAVTIVEFLEENGLVLSVEAPHPASWVN